MLCFCNFVYLVIFGDLAMCAISRRFLHNVFLVKFAKFVWKWPFLTFLTILGFLTIFAIFGRPECGHFYDLIFLQFFTNFRLQNLQQKAEQRDVTRNVHNLIFRDVKNVSNRKNDKIDN